MSAIASPTTSTLGEWTSRRTFKVEQQLNHIINVENVLLVADDFAYVPYLQDLKNKGVEVVVFQDSENSGSRMYHRFLETQNATTVTIELPRSQQFTVEALSTMIQRIGEGGFP